LQNPGWETLVSGLSSDTLPALEGLLWPCDKASIYILLTMFFVASDKVSPLPPPPSSKRIIIFVVRADIPVVRAVALATCTVLGFDAVPITRLK
jgi:hypothetical protein